jgi:hypothetical protein
MKWETRQFRIWAIAALMAGLLLRIWFIRHLALVAGDSLLYGDIASNLIQHGVYGFTSGSTPPDAFGISPTLIRLPGYPLFLAVCFGIFGVGQYNAVMYIQAIADLVTCCLASALAGRLFGSRPALVVLWLAVLCPFTARYVAVPLTETLVLTFTSLAFYGFSRWQEEGRGYNRWLWIVSVAVASSIQLRPEQILFAVAILSTMLWASLSHPHFSSRRLHLVLPVFAASLCVVLSLVPWTIRNGRTFHVFQPLAPRYANDPGELAPLGFSRWYRTWAIDFASTENVYWNYSGDPIQFTDLPTRAFEVGSPSATADLRSRTESLFADYNATTGLTNEVSTAIDARFAKLAAERIRAHPILCYIGLPVARVLNMTLRPRTEMMNIPLEWWKWKQHRMQTAFATAYATLNFAYLALGMAGFFAWKRRKWISAPAPNASRFAFRELAIAMAASILLRAALLLTLDNSEPRYTLEFFPVLFVLAGALFAEPLHLQSVRERGGR